MVVVSSCRDAGCPGNERNPLSHVTSIKLGTVRDSGDKPEEGGDDVKSSCPYGLGYTRTTMATTSGADL